MPGRLIDWEKRLARIPADIKAETIPAVQTGAEEIAARMRTTVAQDEGDLRDTIAVEPGRHELARRVVAGGPKTTKPTPSGEPYDYAYGVEFGTSEARANPFFRPAADQLRKRVMARIGRAVRKGIKKGTPHG